MIRIILLISFSLHLFASDTIKIKAKQTANIVQVKFQIKAIIYSPEIAKKLTTKPYYFSHISATSGDRIVYDVFLSPYLSRDPFFMFKYKSTGTGNILNLSATDNNGKKVEKSRTIKNSSIFTTDTNLNTFKFDRVSQNSDVWNATNSDEAIKKLYGSQRPIDGDFMITPNGVKGSYFILDEGICFGHGGKIDLSIKSDMDLSSIAIFQDANPHSTIAIFQSHENSIIDYRFRFVMKKTSTVTIIGKGKDGRLYKGEQTVYIPPGSHHNCYGEYTGP